MPQELIDNVKQAGLDTLRDLIARLAGSAEDAVPAIQEIIDQMAAIATDATRSNESKRALIESLAGQLHVKIRAQWLRETIDASQRAREVTQEVTRAVGRMILRLLAGV